MADPVRQPDSSILGPLRFVPFLRPMVWGGRRLGDLLGKPLETSGPYGESWDLSDHPLHRSVVAEGPWAGRSLRDLMEHEAEALLGPAAGRYPTFPWLVKFLDAQDWLSVQVHPDAAAVRKLWPGEGSKTECWFVLDARPGSRIYAGLLPGVDARRLRQALADGTVTDCLHSFEPRPGDSVFLPAGTVHAVGGGVLMAEVQQTSDATFRLFDWNRRDAQGRMRALHLEEALACIHWDQGPVRPVSAEGSAGAERGGRSPGPRRQLLVRCPYFVQEYLQADQPFPCGGEGCLQVLLVLQGSGRLSGGSGDVTFRPGQAWLLPAAMPEGRCHPVSEVKALLCTLPG
jgi:mannose-6-phosphate isomerase